MIKSSLKRNSEKFVQRITGNTQATYQSVNDDDKLSTNTINNNNEEEDNDDDDDDELNDENECYSVNKMN